jgi:anti-anti-sigma regulatory factor
VTQLVACPEDVVVHLSGDICVVRLQGSLGRSSAQRIDYLVSQIRSAECTSVLIDASLLGGLSEGCLDGLAALRQALIVAGGDIVVYGASGPAADALASIASGQ